MTTERWRPIPGWAGYDVSDIGQVRSFQLGEPRLLKPFRVTSGHWAVGLYGAEGKKTRNVHVLVMVAFVGPRPAGYEVRHVDGYHANNALSNLAYGTRVENVNDRTTHGVHHEASKTHCPQGHPFDEVNTYVRSDRQNSRDCRRCRAAAVAAFRRRRSNQLERV